MVTESSSKQVTIIARHNVHAGKESLFEGWLGGIQKACQTFNGFVGTETIKRVDAKELHYVCIFRFDNFQNLEKWMESTDRSEWLSKSTEFSDAGPEYEHYQQHGLDIWFTEPRKTGNGKPVFWKQVALGVMTVYPLILLLNVLLSPISNHLPFKVSLLLTVVALSALLTWPVMPYASKLLGNWLRPNK